MRSKPNAEAAVILALVAGCASAPPPEPDCRLDHGRSPAASRPAPLPAPDGVCEGMPDGPDRAACAIVVRGRRFSAPAIAACRDLAATAASAAVECLVAVADVVVSESAAATCAGFAGSDRARCFEAVAGRRLSDGQLRACAQGAGGAVSPLARLECLEGAVDYVFEPEELHWLAAEAARAAPPRAEAPPALRARLLDLATLDPDARARTLEEERTVKQAQQARLRHILDGLQDAVVARYPDVPLRRDHNAFLFNFAGGANAQLYILYCSHREYLILFGSPMPVNAYSGTYQMDVHDWTLTGRMTTFHQGDHHTRDFYGGSHAYLPVGLGKVYSTEGVTYMLEYGRGDISSAYAFGIDAPADYVTLDDGNREAQTARCKEMAKDEVFAADRRAAAARDARAARRAAIRAEAASGR